MDYDLDPVDCAHLQELIDMALQIVEGDGELHIENDDGFLIEVSGCEPEELTGEQIGQLEEIYSTWVWQDTLED